MASRQSACPDQHRRILLATRLCYLDESNGAAAASRDMMAALYRRGHDTRVLCGFASDSSYSPSLAHWLVSRSFTNQLPGNSGCSVGAAGIFTSPPQLFEVEDRGVHVEFLAPSSSNPRCLSFTDISDFNELLISCISKFKPDVIFTYGGCKITDCILETSRKHGIPTAFFLHNIHYTDRDFLDKADVLCVPSDFAANFYLREVGVRARILPNVVDKSRVISKTNGRYILFVNPAIEKGALVFARIADILGSRRPDIPFLVVESRSNERDLAGCGLDLRKYGNVFLMGPTTNPSDFWREAKITLMPSLCEETFGRIAVESLANGLPVLASDRGALPEVLGSAGQTFPLPARLKPDAAILPSPSEVAAFANEIERLYDDDKYYAKISSNCIDRFRHFDSDTVLDILEPIMHELCCGPTRC